jgi:hypothetical protein
MAKKLIWKTDPTQKGTRVLWCQDCKQEVRPRVTHEPMERKTPKSKKGAPRKRIVATCPNCKAEKAIGHKGMPPRPKKKKAKKKSK